ncbi:hypothetical protein FHS29_003138 [Saccharothrix tamanrassetensis]|uniref:Secreted protein n=1 Tax=Saccharothrix tamanrassetensis TaxID=1051531 RepID=A0A841CDF4_9PSEU|nr:hypothetical protein [Saccharothrix tamanrassetensis]MBB5956552.1 hypothetical protein [Saccharothrix tamanrassetensis]
MGKIGWGVAAAAVVVVGALALTMTGGDGATPVAGDCANIAGQADRPRYQPLDCGSEHANVKIAKVVEGEAQCPKGGAPYSTYTGSVTLCLIPNFVEGACYRQDREAGVRKADCAATDSVRVVKVARGNTEDCGDSRRLAYPEPSVTFCLTRPSPHPDPAAVTPSS